MSEELQDLIPLAKLAKLLPPIRGDKPPSRNTLYTWATKGLKSRSGHQVKLDTQFIGGVLCSSLADVRRLGERKDDVAWKPPRFQATHRELEQIAKRGREAIDQLRRERGR